MDIPSGKLRDKGVPIENLSKYDGREDRICLLTCAQELKGRKLVFATKLAMVKQVPGEEFETNNRMVAATKLADGDQVADIQMMDGAREAVLQTDHGVFLRFAAEEIPVQKKMPRESEELNCLRKSSWRPCTCWERIQTILPYTKKNRCI